MLGVLTGNIQRLAASRKNEIKDENKALIHLQRLQFLTTNSRERVQVANLGGSRINFASSSRTVETAPLSQDNAASF